jgi:hypothetical protein
MSEPRPAPTVGRLILGKRLADYRDQRGDVVAWKPADGRVAVREPTEPDGLALIWTTHDIKRFIPGARAGDADLLVEDLRRDRRERGSATAV